MQVLEAFIAQHYLGSAPPPQWVTSHAVSKSLVEALSQQTGMKIAVQHNPREQRRIWLEMCEKGADLALGRLLAEEGSQRERTRALADAIDLVPDDLDTLAHRVLRHQPHRRRGDAGVVRGLRGPQDAERAVPALQHHRHHRRRRLRRDAAGAHAALLALRRGAGRGRRGGRRAADRRGRRASDASRRTSPPTRSPTR